MSKKNKNRGVDTISFVPSPQETVEEIEIEEIEEVDAEPVEEVKVPDNNVSDAPILPPLKDVPIPPPVNSVPIPPPLETETTKRFLKDGAHYLVITTPANIEYVKDKLKRKNESNPEYGALISKLFLFENGEDSKLCVGPFDTLEDLKPFRKMVSLAGIKTFITTLTYSTAITYPRVTIVSKSLDSTKEV